MSVTKTPNLKDEEHPFLKHRPDGENILRLFRLSEVKGINNKKHFVRKVEVIHFHLILSLSIPLCRINITKIFPCRHSTSASNGF